MANNYNIKQVIIIRGDLNYGTKGKMAAMIAHASVGAITQYGANVGHYNINGASWVQWEFKFPDPISQWLEGDFAKIVLKCNTLEDMMQLQLTAQSLDLPNKLITDNGTTVFEGKTITALAIGPWYSEDIDKITGHLKLL